MTDKKEKINEKQKRIVNKLPNSQSFGDLKI